MALTNKDIERIGEIMAARLADALQEVNKAVHTHGQTLYGATKDNGLVKDVKELQKDVGKIKVWTAKVSGGIAVVALAAKEGLSWLFGNR